MENNHLSGQETVPISQGESSLQVSGETRLLSQNSDELLLEEKDDTLSSDDASVSDFDEEENINNNEEHLQTKDVDALEANNENQKSYELCIGMEFSSDESAYKAYRKYGGNHGFDVKRQRTSRKNQKLVRVVYVCSKEGFRQEPKVKKSFSRPTTRRGCQARISC
uniref:FAR1 domain-containing protein n=1 Tax=Brassica oleracea var. oleracea TaxID=109376 RepID=A0A0D3AAX7_BRAOL